MVPKTKVDLIKRISELQSEITFLQSINTGCRGCMHFGQGGCRLADGQTPPADVLEKGCNEWVWDEVPF